MKKYGFLFLLVLLLLSFVMVSCGVTEEPVSQPQTDTEEIDERKQIYELALKSGYTGTYEQWLDSIKGNSIELRVSNGDIEWKYKNSSSWTKLISLVDLSGANGVDGKTPEFKVEDGFIKWRYIGEADTQWKNILALSNLTGADGTDGLTPELRVNDGYIEWKYTTENTWKKLIELASLTGAKGQDSTDGLTPELRVNEGYIEWKYTADTEWKQLVELATLIGPKGENGVDGKPGDDGLSAYEIYIKYHPEYTKTEEEWLLDLINGNLVEKEESVMAEGLVWNYIMYQGEISVCITGNFGNCEELVIPSTIEGKKVVYIGNNVFGYNSTIKSVVIPEGVVYIGSNNFAQCPNLETITLPKSLKNGGVNLFSYSYVVDVYYGGTFEEWINLGDLLNNLRFTGHLYIKNESGEYEKIHSVNYVYEDDYHYAACMICGEVLSEKEAHDIQMIYNDYYHYEACIYCYKVVSDYEDHTWDEGVIIQEPTEDEYGYIEYK